MLRTLVLIALATASASSQTALWTDVDPGRAASRPDLVQHRTVRLDLEAFRLALEAATDLEGASIPLPLPEGGVLEVDALEVPVLAPGLQARFPSIRTYVVSGALSGRVAVTPHGVTGLVHGSDGAVAFDPIGPSDALEAETYVVYRPSDVVLEGEMGRFEDVVEVLEASETLPGTTFQFGETLRTLRLAVATTGEFTTSRGGTLELGLAAVAASVNRVNAIVERDLAVRFELARGNDQLIFLDATTDPFSEREDALLAQVQEAIDAIGSNAYDLGHLLTTGVTGYASIGTVCDHREKGKAYSGAGGGETVYSTYLFAHELGHQLGAQHSFVTSNGGTFNVNGVEPGPGYTIMAYPYLATERPEEERIGLYFHGVSIGQIVRRSWYDDPWCGASTQTGNDLPIVSVALESPSVPLGAFIVLEGAATDATGSSLSYVWEQVDTYGNGLTSLPTYRSVDPGPERTRTLPDLEAALAGELGLGEVFVETPGSYSFLFTVRDNAAGGGAVASQGLEVEVRPDTFAVTSHADPIAYTPGSPMVVTWTPQAVTNSGPEGLGVDVLLSSDGGATWSLAAEGVPDTGTTVVEAPPPTTRGHVMVRPVGQPYFAVGAAPFVSGAAPALALSASSIDLRLPPEVRDTVSVVVTNVGDPGTVLEVTAALRDARPAVDSLSGGFRALWSSESDDPDPAFIDISPRGRAVTFLPAFGYEARDNGVAHIELPFELPFFGAFEIESDLGVRIPPAVVVSTNGVLLFTTCATEECGRRLSFPSNRSIFGFGYLPPLIAPFWDDLEVGSGTAYTDTLPDGRFVVQYDRFRLQSGEGEYTFQVLISPDGDLEVRYEEMSGPTDGASIGIMGYPNGAGKRQGIEFAYNEVVDFGGTTVSFRQRPPAWAPPVVTSASLSPGASVEIPVPVSTMVFGDGALLSADLVLDTNDGSRRRVVVPIRVEVGQPVASDPALEAASVSLVAPNPTSSVATVNIALEAVGPLTVTVYDALGRAVAVPFEGVASGDLEVAIEAGGLAPGLYVVRVVGDGFAESRTFVVAR